jgi:hypothetical protein
LFAIPNTQSLSNSVWLVARRLAGKRQHIGKAKLNGNVGSEGTALRTACDGSIHGSLHTEIEGSCYALIVNLCSYLTLTASVLNKRFRRIFFSNILRL